MHNLRSPVVLQCTPRSSSHHVLMFSFNSIIIRVWSYGGLRSSPLSRNRELMQRIARIGYLKLGVICKCRVRLALDETRKREELPHPPPPPSFSPLFPSPLAHCPSLSFSLSPFANWTYHPAGEGRRHLTTFVMLSDMCFFFFSSSNASSSFLVVFSSFHSPSFTRALGRSDK